MTKSIRPFLIKIFMKIFQCPSKTYFFSRIFFVHLILTCSYLLFLQVTILKCRQVPYFRSCVSKDNNKQYAYRVQAEGNAHRQHRLVSLLLTKIKVDLFTSFLYCLTYLRAHREHNTRRASGVYSSAQGEKETTLPGPSQVIPQPTRWPWNCSPITNEGKAPHHFFAISSNRAIQKMTVRVFLCLPDSISL